MRTSLALATAFVLAVSGLAQAQTPAAPAAAAAVKLSGQSTFRQLVANPKSRDILDRNIPNVMMVFDMGLFPDSVTLQVVSEDEQAQTGGGLTAEVYARILKELAAL